MKLAELLEKYLDGMDVIAVKRYGSEYIVMYHDERDVCTPYIIHHLNDSGLYSGRYFVNENDAKEEF